MNTYKFLIGDKTYTFKAASMVAAMERCNREVVDAMNVGHFAWMDTSAPDTFRMALGNFFD
jgi:hypothetical protein